MAGEVCCIGKGKVKSNIKQIFKQKQTRKSKHSSNEDKHYPIFPG